MYIGIFLTMMAYYILVRNDILIIPGIALILIMNIIDKPRRLFHGLALILSIVFFRNVFFSRFYVIQIVFPAVIAYFMSNKKNNSNYSLIRLYVYFAFGIGLVLIYGVISEVIKLNIY